VSSILMNKFGATATRHPFNEFRAAHSRAR
jgi:hypothetical protein